MAWNYADGPAQSYKRFATVTDQDLTSAANAGAVCAGLMCRWIEVGGAGTLVVTKPDGTNETLPTMPAGHRFIIQAKALVASGSSATDVVVYW